MNASLCSATMLSWNRNTRAQTLRQGKGSAQKYSSHNKWETNMDAQVKKAADLDVLVVGAGFSGLYILHELVKRNYKVHLFDDGERSEERRVGKECRSRWSPDH